MRRLLPKRFQYDPVGLGTWLADMTLPIGIVLLVLVLVVDL